MAVPSHTLRATKSPINCLVYNNGCSYFLAGSSDQSIRLFNPSSANLVQTYKEHGYEVLSLSVASSNSNFASGGGDRSVFWWDVGTGKVIRRFAGHRGKINTVCINEQDTVLCSGSYDASVKIWDLKSQNRLPIQSLDDAKDSISSIVTQSSTIYTGCVDGYLRTYDLRKGQLTCDFMGRPITSLMPSKDGQTILVSLLSSRKVAAQVVLLDLANGSALQTFEGHKNDSYRIAPCFGHKEQSVISGDEDGFLWRWNLIDGGLIEREKISDKQLNCVVENLERKDGSETIAGGGEGTIWIWNNKAS
ncbi:WD40 repeat-like protein [Atractiella rhizophila]|nr:WD40 repeat-like protein [Atractiella rhizophila]